MTCLLPTGGQVTPGLRRSSTSVPSLCLRATKSLHFGNSPASQLGKSLSSPGKTQRPCRLVTKAMAAVSPITVVGKGRVGQALKDMGEGDDVLVGRGEAIEGPAGPIVVCTRNNDLQGKVAFASMLIIFD